MGTLAGGTFSLLAFAFTGRLGAFGLGDHDLIESLNGGLVWTAALCLLVAKLLATAFCYGAGGCGGIFAPLLFFGAMAGVLVTGLTPAQLGLTSQDQTLLALTGMTACLGAVVRAPITSILIVMEMTRQIYALPALMIAAVVSVYMNRLCFRGKLLRRGVTPGRHSPRPSLRFGNFFAPSDFRNRSAGIWLWGELSCLCAEVQTADVR